MARRPPPPAKPPFWHRSRLGWVNALGFALTLFLGVWLLMAIFSNLLPKSEPIRFGIPVPFVIVLGLAQVTTIALGAIVVSFMWRGADFHTHQPRLYVFWWTCAGLLFFLVDLVTFIKFGAADLPNAAPWAEHMYFGIAPIGLLCFGLMAYVNIDIPSEDEEVWHEDEDGEYEEYEDEIGHAES
ncbi:MAG: hypothetical protein QNJ90_11145 [Planctomycetota bacterium]|nr:hypothetical protein [Planctomycetota bacterium]